MDFCLGEFLNAREETGLDERTTVILTADHGTNIGEWGKFVKSFPVHEQEARTPFIVCLPGARGPRSLWCSGRPADHKPVGSAAAPYGRIGGAGTPWRGPRVAGLGSSRRRRHAAGTSVRGSRWVLRAVVSKVREDRCRSCRQSVGGIPTPPPCPRRVRSPSDRVRLSKAAQAAPGPM
jgi:hypothetical protein